MCRITRMETGCSFVGSPSPPGLGTCWVSGTSVSSLSSWDVTLTLEKTHRPRAVVCGSLASTLPFCSEASVEYLLGLICCSFLLRTHPVLWLH